MLGIQLPGRGLAQLKALYAALQSKQTKKSQQFFFLTMFLFLRLIIYLYPGFLIRKLIAVSLASCLHLMKSIIGL